MDRKTVHSNLRWASRVCACRNKWLAHVYKVEYLLFTQSFIYAHPLYVPTLNQPKLFSIASCFYIKVLQGLTELILENGQFSHGNANVHDMYIQFLGISSSTKRIIIVIMRNKSTLELSLR